MSGAARGRFLLPLLVLAVALGVYANTLGNGFTYDDEWLIVNNPRLGDWTYARDMILARELWRPVKRITLMADHALWGKERPFGFHLTSVLLQGAACLLLYRLALRLGLRPEVAAFTALLFAVHPVHVEAVANVSHRKEPLALLFYLLALLAYLAARRAPGQAAQAGWLAAAGLSYLLAMGSKEVGGVMFPLVALAAELLLPEAEDPGRRRRLALFAVSAGAAILIFTVRGEIGSIPGRFAPEEIGWVTQNRVTTYAGLLPLVVQSFGAYAGLALVPWPLYLDRPFAIPAEASGVVLGLVALLAWVAGVAWCWRRAPVAAFGLLWYGINLVPVINLVPLTHWFVAERLLYVPSAGLCLAAGVAFARLLPAEGRPPSALRTAGLAAAILILAAGAALTVLQNRVWRDNRTLWAHNLRHHPESFRAQGGYGTALLAAGKPDEAEPYLRKAVELQPAFPPPHYQLAVIALMRGRLDEALAEARRYAEAKPRDARPWVLIGNAEANRGQPEAAVAAYRMALDRDPGSSTAVHNLAAVLLAARRPEAALEVIAAAPEPVRDHELLVKHGQAEEMLGRAELAAAAYREALARAPAGERRTPLLVAGGLARLGQRTEATALLERLAAAHPDDAEVRRALDRLRSGGGGG